jgi:hypothetical protein
MHPSGVPQTLPQWQMLVKPRSGGGLLLLRRKTPFPQCSVVYFCSGAHMLDDLSRACNVGTKKNSKGYKET